MENSMDQQKQTYISPIDNIRNSYSSLSSAQKTIANLILDQAENVCFMRLEDISKKIGVTNVTVIRFVKKIGYESFGAFKKDLQNYIQNNVVPKRIVKSEVSAFRDSSVDDMIHRVIQNEFDLMKATYDAIPIEVLYETALCIKNARKIYIVGTGLNEPVSKVLLTRLKYFSLDAQIIHDDNSTLLPYSLINIGKACQVDLYGDIAMAVQVFDIQGAGGTVLVEPIRQIPDTCQAGVAGFIQY